MIADIFGELSAPLVDLLSDELQQGRTGDDRLGRALSKELDSKISRTGLESLGFTFEPRIAMYAVGASFVMRMDFKDGSKLSALVDRVDAAAPFEMQKKLLAASPTAR